MSFTNLSKLICKIDEYQWDPNPIGDISSFGKVFKGERKNDDKHFQVAIKILFKSNLTNNFEEKKHFMREIGLLNSTGHPFCLNLVNFCLDKPAIITPFIEQGSLGSFLRNQDPKSKNYKELNATQKMCSIYSICSTMDAIHAYGMIHRDFKPDNVFMKKNGEIFDILIADFGSARMLLQNIELTECPNGTPNHQAPESFDSNYYTNSVDVYSFGVVLLQYFDYKAVTKFDDGRNTPKMSFPLISAIKGGKHYQKPKNMPDELYNIYLMCSKLNDIERPTFEELSHMFETDESLWIDDTNVNVYKQHIERCKKICQEYKQSHKNPFCFDESELTTSTNLTRQARLSTDASPSVSPSSSSSSILLSRRSSSRRHKHYDSNDPK